MPIQPVTVWAQRKDALFVTVEVFEPQDVKVNIEEQSLSVTCKKDNQEYAVTLPLYAKVNVEESKWAVKRGIMCHLAKVEKARWPALLENKQKRQNLKCDWNRWLDTDDEEEANKGGAGGFNMDDFDMSGMGGMGGMGGLGDMGDMGGFDGHESDEESLDHEDAEDETEMNGQEASENATKSECKAEAGCCAEGNEPCHKEMCDKADSCDKDSCCKSTDRAEEAAV
eukprot:Gregarina_sp_Poly_1__6114@NODE_322_length_9532_cov_315_419546_g274_i0_p6_GENE_NODE_322_length_9532_cov_315_419546_g274_i0NODE_322_length_9532_cov_315_419546_g274_i0_p6_ORF_typecomplete_len226_score56_09CS/PF04969_16/8_8e13PIH1_CS/PF18201_1/0_12ArsA_HSP20/PF17886_1/0_1fn3_6/PF17766_1/0_1HSP20/PF00011_21/0_19SDA1/PF05285_12/4_8_NODE_322_length_9532_cov_315_419546_g274_i087559432